MNSSEKGENIREKFDHESKQERNETIELLHQGDVFKVESIKSWIQTILSLSTQKYRGK
jgi:hypothetical protein